MVISWCRRLGGPAAILVLISAITFATVCAAGDSLPAGVTPGSPGAASWSLQFQVGEDFTLHSFQGGLISCKRQFTERSALRLGLGITGKLHDSSKDQIISSTATTTTEKVGADRDDQGIEINAQYVYYILPDRRIKPYYGLGPVFGFSRAKDETYAISQSERGDSLLQPREWEHEVLRKTWCLGLSGLLGAEWFFTDRISLTAEYGAVLEYERQTQQSSYSSTTNDTSTEMESTVKEFKFGPSSVKLGLSVYF